MVLKLAVQEVLPDLLIHWLDRREIWASRNYTFYESKDQGKTFHRKVDLPSSSLIRLLGKSRLLARTFRLGIRDCRRLQSGTVLAIADGKIFRLEDNAFTRVHSFSQGLGPLREGWCEDDEGNCYLGEYVFNNRRDKTVSLLKSTDDGYSWKVIRSFKNIRHIHCVQFDPFSQTVWIGTGDKDSESSIAFSKDQGKTWTTVGSGSQMFRAVSLVFRKDFVYWGSDAPSIQNYIYRYTRKNGRVEKTAPVGGPVHYSTVLEDGTILLSTSAEGDSEGKGAQWDFKAHLWVSVDEIHWEDIASWEKDAYPHVLGFGRVYFPHGTCRDNVFFTTEALKKADNTLFRAKLLVEQ